MDDVFKVPQPPGRKPRLIRPLTESSQNLPKHKTEPELQAQPFSKIPIRSAYQKPKRLHRSYQLSETSLIPEPDSIEPDPPFIKADSQNIQVDPSTIKVFPSDTKLEPTTQTVTEVAKPSATKVVPLLALKPGTSVLISKSGQSTPRIIRGIPASTVKTAGSSSSMLNARPGTPSSSTSESSTQLKPGTSLLKSKLTCTSKLTRISPTSMLKPRIVPMKPETTPSIRTHSSSIVKTGSSTSFSNASSSSLSMTPEKIHSFLNMEPSSTVHTQPSTAYMNLPSIIPLKSVSSIFSENTDLEDSTLAKKVAPSTLTGEVASSISVENVQISTSAEKAEPSQVLKEGFASLPPSSGLVILANQAAAVAQAEEEARKVSIVTSVKRKRSGKPLDLAMMGKGKGNLRPSSIKRGYVKSGPPPSAGRVPPILRVFPSAEKSKPSMSSDTVLPGSTIRKTEKNAEILTIATFIHKVKNGEGTPEVLNPDLDEVRETTLDIFNELIEKTFELEELKEQHEELKNKYKRLEWDYYKLTGTNIDLSTYNTNLNQVNTRLTEQLESLASELRTYEIKCKKFEMKDKENNKKLKRLQRIEKEYSDLKVRYDLLSCNCNEMIKEIQHWKSELKELQDEKSFLQQEVIGGQLLRRTLHNTVQELKGNIQVYCRIRAPSNGEHDRPRFGIGFPNQNSLEMQKTKAGKPTDPVKVMFTFDKVLRPVANQAECFQELVQFVQSALDGFDVCILAYGQTGSGKTYTLQGRDELEHTGFMFRAVTFMFKTIEYLRTFEWSYEVKASFIEIFGERIRDLLDPNMNENPPLEIQVDEGTGLSIENLKILPVESFDAFAELMNEAERNRVASAANFSERCAKSHAIYKVSLTGTNKECNGSYVGSLTLVDLAGSELSKTGSNEWLEDSAASLPVLGNVLVSIYNKDKLIPFKSSKLTCLLQFTLGGSSKTLLMVHVSPFEENYQESLKTLRFASKIKEVRPVIKRVKALPSPQQASTSSGHHS
ncbi:uncharacterized protein [Leptinotarsa decemlineata]|uniref:uncharacterized protein n=1 Tax=Leptinotarsa decemlineata TaxID=7539 RepID=UPI003D30AAAB